MKSKIHIQSYFDIYKQPWSVVIFINSEKNDGFNFSSHSWNPFKDVEKQCHGRPAIGGHLTNQFCQRGGSQGQDFQHISQNQILSFLKTFVGLHFKNQFYQEGKWEFQHFSQNRLMSWKEPRYKWNCLCISVWQNKFTMNVEDMGKICQNFSQFLMIVFNLLCI